MFQLARAWRAKQIRPEIEEQKAFYEREWTPEDIRTWQLDRFNEQWASIQHTVPYFARLKRQEELPEVFSSWEQFRGLLPAIGRETVQQHGNALRSTKKAPDFHRVTGGSTSEPVHLPAWSSEHEYARPDVWYGRDWYDITPADRLFLFMGQTYLFGEGLHGWWKKTKRQLKDRVLGYHRFPPYELSEEALRKGGNEMLQHQPAYVVGLSGVLDRFAQVNMDRKSEFRDLDLKAAVGTSEPFFRSNGPQCVSELFGAPATMEYGAVETGAMAYQAPDGRYHIFWRHHLVEGRQTDADDGRYELLVTSLYPRCFPLVRYRLGDVVPDDVTARSFDQTLSDMTGRRSDYLTLADGRRIHSEVFTDVTKHLSAVRGYQVRQQPDHDLTLTYVMDNGDLNDEEKRTIRERLVRIDPALRGVRLQRVASLEQTTAGKTKRVVRE